MTSFEFSFTKNPQKSATGKVFAKKRKTKPTEAATATPTPAPANKVAEKPPNNRPPKKTFKNNQLPKQNVSFPNNNTLVKRKKKKDKQIAQSNTEGDEPPEKPLHKSTHSLFSEKYKSLHIEVNTRGKSLVEKVFSVNQQKFSDLKIHKYIVSNLEKINFTTLTTVQEKSIPPVLEGKNVLVIKRQLKRSSFSFTILFKT